MEKTITNLNDLLSKLQKLLTLHRQLMDSLRSEREALLAVDVKRVQDAALEKQGILDQIALIEQERLAASRVVATQLNAPRDKSSLSHLVLLSQAVSLKISDQLRSVQQALVHLIGRIQEQNQANRKLVESSIEHVGQMKKNVIGETAPRSGTYSASGQAHHAPAQSRLISTEI